MAFFNEAKTCEMVTRPAKCVSENHNQNCNPTQLTQEGCCEDQTLLIKGQDELAQAASVSMSDIQMVCVLYAVTSFLLTPASVDTDSYKEYSPPLIGRDIPVLVQAFLI